MQLLCFNQVCTKNFLLLWFIVQIPLCIYGESVSQGVRQTVTKPFSYVPPHTQHRTLLSTVSTIIPESSSHSSIVMLTSRTLTLATSSTYLSLSTSTSTSTPSRPISTISLNITVQVPSYAYEGEEVLFNCSVEPSQNVTFSWRLQDEIVAATAQYITTLRDNNNDLYCCEVNNTFYGASNHSCLTAPIVYFISSVTISYTPQSQINLYSLLHCSAIASNESVQSDVRYYWEYVGRSGNTQSIHSQTSEYGLNTDNSRLIVTGTSLTLSGTYTCSSYLADHISTVRSLSRIVQQYSPISLQFEVISPISSFLPPGSQLGVEIGGSLQVHCIGTGLPIQLLTWQIDGNNIQHSPPDIIIVEISRRNPDVIGGYATESGQVTVSVFIPNVQNPIDKLTCVGNNIMGRRESSISVVLLAPPCTPENVNIRELGETWVVIEWINGVDCFAGIQNVVRFILNITELSAQEVMLIPSSVNTQLSSYNYNFTSLTSDSFYEVKISGENAYGPSDNSAPITLHTLALPDTNKIMFPFGIIPGDSLVAHDKYAQSLAISFKQTVPIGSRLSSVVYLSPLGVLSFDKPFHYWDVQMLGAGSSLQDLSILAPFWSDVDYSSQGNLFYQLYSDSHADSQILHNATQLVIQSANAPPSFNASSLLVATWSRVLPSSGSQSQAFKENSFQLGLVTDHITTYALYGYKRGDMSWSTVLGNDPLIGFSTASTLLQTHPLSRTPNAHEIDLTSGDELTIIGYNVSYSLQEITTAEQLCSAWQQSASRLELITPVCPCTLLQAAADERFTIDNISPQIPDIACYISLFESVGPNQRCCYSKRLMTIISEGIHRGSSLLINPTTRGDLHLSGDYKAYENCCLLSDSCDKFFAARVSNNCSQYTPTGFVWGFSLAHAITADSNEYRINGLGEYWLMNTAAPCPIQVQARTELVQGFNVTSFTAISLSESICGSNIFISLSSDKTKLMLYLNNTEVTMTSQELAAGCILLTNLSLQSFSIRFSFGFSLSVWALNTVLNFKMTLPRETCYNRTQGLIGQWNGDASNDLLMRNGTLLSQNVTDREKEVFAESWRLTEEESFMVYETGNYSIYNPTDFEPTTFIDEILSAGASPEIVGQCTDKRSCLFDQLLTGEQGLANYSRDTSLISIETEMEINTYPPHLTGSSVLVISTREEFSYTLTAVNLHSHPMSLYVSSPIRNTILSFSDEVYKLTGSISQEIGEFRISFHATDLTTGLVSRQLSPTILFCTCAILSQCSLSSQQQMAQREFYNLSCGCEKGINITDGHSCIISPDCIIQQEMYFVIDSTSNLGPTRFSEELELAVNLIDRFNYPPGTIGNRVGYLLFTDNIVSYTNITGDFNTAITQLESTTFPGGNTNLTSPLEFLLRHIFTEKSSIQSLVVYMTAGSQSTSSVDIDVLASLSEELEMERGVRIVVIGFGTSLNETQLAAISTRQNAVDNYLAFNSIAEAQNNISEITKKLCQTVIPATTSTTQTAATTYQSTTHTSQTTTPTPTSNLVLVTLKFTLSYATLYSLTNGDIDGFLSAIVRGLDNKVPIGTISSVDGYIEVSFEIDRNEINPLQIESMLYQSQLRQLSPYLTEVLLTEYNSIDSISVGLASNVFSYIAATVSISLIIFLLFTHTQLRIVFGVEKMESKDIESENNSEFLDEVAPMLTERRTRITRPGANMPQKSSISDVLLTERAASVKSESASYYGKSSISEIPLFKPRARIMSRPLSPEQISDLLLESPPYTIQLEFDALPSNLVSVDEMPPGTESKNRYPNILPPPHSRVPLFLKFNMPTSDYINANFVRGYNMMSRAYIATQGPMYNTIDEFWRMVWEQRCEVILMLTELVERGSHKCTHYWPEKGVSANAIFGELEVTPGDKEYKSCYILSRFKIKLRTDTENKEVREVNHLWFKQWPDYGNPETGIPIITLLLDSRTYVRNSQSPVLMHCSSGIGRTGVFIAVDVGMHELEKKGRADLLKIVSLIRQDRGGMVQTKDQYLLIYKTLLAYSDFLKKAQQPD